MTQDDKIKLIVFVIAGVATFAGVIAFVTWLADHPVVAAILLTLAGVLLVIALVVGTVGITAMWTRETMRQGAEIALQSQHIDGQWEAKKTQALGALVREVVHQTAVNLPRPSDLPALPLPSQSAGEWLPPLLEFSQQDVIDAWAEEAED